MQGVATMTGSIGRDRGDGVWAQKKDTPPAQAKERAERQRGTETARSLPPATSLSEGKILLPAPSLVGPVAVLSG